jgi:hypothetical protein
MHAIGYDWVGLTASETGLTASSYALGCSYMIAVAVPIGSIRESAR